MFKLFERFSPELFLTEGFSGWHVTPVTSFLSLANKESSFRSVAAVMSELWTRFVPQNRKRWTGFVRPCVEITSGHGTFKVWTALSTVFLPPCLTGLRDSMALSVKVFWNLVTSVHFVANQCLKNNRLVLLVWALVTISVVLDLRTFSHSGFAIVFAVKCTNLVLPCDAWRMKSSEAPGLLNNRLGWCALGKVTYRPVRFAV